MSTVVLTQHYIASDHMVVESTLPHTTWVDTNHDKIFIHPKKHFLFALAGDFDPEEMRSEKVMAFAEMLVTKSIELRSTDYKKKFSVIKDDAIFKEFQETFGNEGEIFLITPNDRVTLMPIEKFKSVAVQTLGEMYGLGTGGNYAVGLLRGGMAITDIWPHVNRLADTSSVEHTIIPLDILKEEV